MRTPLLLACVIGAALAARSTRGVAQPSPSAGGESSAARVASPQDEHAGGASALQGDVERGRYLVEHVAMCIECHSPRDAGGTIVHGSELVGAPIPVGPPPWEGQWAIRAPRVRGLPGYDDAQALRLLTEGAIGRDGKQLRPPMPRFRMSRDDAAAVIAYLRSLE